MFVKTPSIIQSPTTSRHVNVPITPDLPDESMPTPSYVQPGERSSRNFKKAFLGLALLAVTGTVAALTLGQHKPTAAVGASVGASAVDTVDTTTTTESGNQGEEANLVSWSRVNQNPQHELHAPPADAAKLAQLDSLKAISDIAKSKNSALLAAAKGLSPHRDNQAPELHLANGGPHHDQQVPPSNAAKLAQLDSLKALNDAKKAADLSAAAKDFAPRRDNQALELHLANGGPHHDQQVPPSNAAKLAQLDSLKALNDAKKAADLSAAAKDFAPRRDNQALELHLANGGPHHDQQVPPSNAAKLAQLDSLKALNDAKKAADLSAAAKGFAPRRDNQALELHLANGGPHHDQQVPPLNAAKLAELDSLKSINELKEAAPGQH
ncbi:Aste57867_18445 [Aphanomyces stellatus]|uniref:Aste57867_18445 protein n=1 Tax=Aphanomyces stellatus TaxID=120398 RepID=A0A485LAC6_9STRA|nr:hypothetical protein As57867_018383 [Aphanomyces stellatus]VFT95181.1 Aste57867_18445 [Aphanomyces stellatus]